MSEKITLDIPENLQRDIQTTREELSGEIRLMAALKMFELGKLSTEKAAELAGLSRIDFIEMCGRYRVSVFNYSPEELANELEEDLRQLRQSSDEAR